MQRLAPWAFSPTVCKEFAIGTCLLCPPDCHFHLLTSAPLWPPTLTGNRNPKDQQFMRMTLNQMLVELDGFKVGLM
jgi:hypothetical protein